jgi:hypothetical protein
MLIVNSSGPVGTGGVVAVGVARVAVGVGVALARIVEVRVGGWRVEIVSVPGAMGGSVASGEAAGPPGCAPPGGTGVAEPASEQANSIIVNIIKQTGIIQRGFMTGSCE